MTLTPSISASGTLVTAVADTGYYFVQWSDGVTTAARTDSNVMADLNVTASFAINIYTLTYTAGSNGTIAGTSPQTVNYDASGTLVTAVPGTGYHFVQWSDGVTTAARTDNNVMADLTVAATFAIDPASLVLSIDGGSSYVRYGRVLTYVVNLHNQGTGPTSNAAITMTLPP